MKVKLRTNLTGVFLIFFFIIFSFSILNLDLNTKIPTRDSGVFLYIADQVLSGKVPYKDLWDHKPPLVYFINALALTIDKHSVWGVWFLEFVSLNISIFFCYLLLKKTFGKISAFFGTTIFLILFGTLLTGGNYTEEYTLPFQFIALYLFISAKKKKDDIYKYILVGIFSSLVFLLKPNELGIILSIIAYLIFQRFLSRNKIIKNEFFWKIILSMTLGFSVVLLLLTVYLLSKNAFKDFIDQVFLYNLIYQKTTIYLKINTVLNFFKILFPTTLLILTAYFLNFYISVKKENKGNINVLTKIALILFPIQLIFTSLSGRDYWHYYLSLLPITAILISFLIYLAENYLKTLNIRLRFNRMISPILIGLIFGIIYLQPLYTIISKNLNLEYRLMGKNLKLRLFRFENYEEKQDTIDLINKTTTKNDPILIYGSESALYYITKRSSPTRYFYQYPLFIKGYINDKKINEFLTDLKNNPPKIIIDASTSTADISAEKSYLLEPIYLPERDKWLKEKGYINQPDEYKDIFDFFDDNYEFIGTTYSNKWYAFRYKYSL